MTIERGKRKIAPPVPGKPALLANVFHALRSANTALMPLFPYTGNGDIVPGATVFWGGPGRDGGVFNHTNSVDEVAICFASERSRMPPGFVHVGARTHLVGGFFEDPTDPEILMVIVVTQRQADAGTAQDETYTFLCSACQAPLLEHRFAAKDAGQATAPFETLIQGGACLEPFNASDDARTCAQCGHHNERFPVGVWGWDTYLKNTVAAERARRQLEGGSHAA